MSNLSDFFGGAGGGFEVHLETLNGNETLSTNYEDYVVVLDGRHRANLELPDATGLSTGAYKFQFRNAMDLETFILDNAGTVLAAIHSQGSIDLHLSNNSITAGEWAATNRSGLSAYNPLSDGDVTSETASVFAANTTAISASALNSTKAIVCYSDQDNSAYGTACVLTISGTTISAGTSAVFQSAGTYEISVSALSSTRAVVCYRDTSSANYGTTCVLTFDGNTISAGTPVVFESGTTYNISVSALSSTKAIVCYRDNDNSDHGTACVLTVDGTTVSAGTPAVFESASTGDISVSRLSSTKALVCYEDDGNLGAGTACVLTVDGTTVSAGTPVAFTSASTDFHSVAALSETKAVVCYRDNDNSNNGTACVLTVDGTTVSAGTPAVFESENSLYIYVVSINSTRSIVYYKNNVNSGRPTYCVLSISGTSVSAGTPGEVFTNEADFISTAVFTGGKMVVCFQDNDDVNKGKASFMHSETTPLFT